METHPTPATTGSPSRAWAASSASYPQWWMVDLGAVTPVSGIRADWYNAAKRAYRYRVEASRDGVNFATVADRSKNLNTGATTDALNVAARYVRVQVLGVSGKTGWASANEITVFTGVDPVDIPTPEPTPSATPTAAPSATPTAALRRPRRPLLRRPRRPLLRRPRGRSQPTGVVVTDFGARGDGVTDDTSAVMAAIAAAKGQPVYFPAGTYYASLER